MEKVEEVWKNNQISSSFKKIQAWIKISHQLIFSAAGKTVRSLVLHSNVLVNQHVYFGAPISTGHSTHYRLGSHRQHIKKKKLSKENFAYLT